MDGCSVMVVCKSGIVLELGIGLKPDVNLKPDVGFETDVVFYLFLCWAYNCISACLFFTRVSLCF